MKVPDDGRTVSSAILRKVFGSEYSSTQSNDSNDAKKTNLPAGSVSSGILREVFGSEYSSTQSSGSNDLKEIDVLAGSLSSGILHKVSGSDYSTPSKGSNDASKTDVPALPKAEAAMPKRYRYSAVAIRALRHEHCSAIPENITKSADVPQRKIVTLKPNPPIPFSALALPKELSDSLVSLSMTTATPIQATAIPYARLGGDMVAQATSGTGKTLTYALVALDSILPASPSKAALVIVPARELASQVSEVFTKLSAVRVVTLVGGTKESVDEERLSRPVNVAVGTPGRVEAMVTRGSLDVASIRILVLDEADRLLDGSFGGSVERVCRMLPTRQTLAFSATFSYSFRMSLLEIMREPAWIGGSQAVHSVVQRKLPCFDLNDKVEWLKKLLQQVKFNLCVVFFNAKKAAGRVVRSLAKSFTFQIKLIHAGMSQKERDAVIRSVRQGMVRVLVTTDVLARGIDFDSCDFVVHMDVPLMAETYLHRVGRAGRFGRRGSALLMFDEREVSAVLSLEEDLGYTIGNNVAIDDEGHFQSLESPPKSSVDKEKSLQRQRETVMNTGEEKNEKCNAHDPNAVTDKESKIPLKESTIRPNVKASREEQAEGEVSKVNTCEEVKFPSDAPQDTSNGSRKGNTVVPSSRVEQAISQHVREQSCTLIKLAAPSELEEMLYRREESKKRLPLSDSAKRPRFPDDSLTPTKKQKSTRIIVDTLPECEATHSGGTNTEYIARSREDVCEGAFSATKKRQDRRLGVETSGLKQSRPSARDDIGTACFGRIGDGGASQIGAREEYVRRERSDLNKSATQRRVGTIDYAYPHRGAVTAAEKSVVSSEGHQINGVKTRILPTSQRQARSGQSGDIPNDERQSDDNFMNLEPMMEAVTTTPSFTIPQQCREAWDRYAQVAYDTGYREAYEEAFRIAQELHQRLEESTG